MAFLNKNNLKNKAETVSVPEHHLLKKCILSDYERVAYLQGCVLASLVDDGKVSEKERCKVRRIGLSLRFRDDEIDEAFENVERLKTDLDKERLVDEIVSLLKKEPLRKSFIRDFENVARSDGTMQSEVAEILDLIGARMYEDEAWQANKSKKSLANDLFNMVEQDMTWPVTYDKSSIFELMKERGINEHQVITLLELLLPKAKDAFAEVRKNLGKMDHYVNRDRHYLALCENKSALRFLNYVKCMSDCTANNQDWALIRDDFKREFDFYWVSLDEVNYSHRRADAAQEARKALLKIYKSLLDEFENMSKF